MKIIIVSGCFYPLNTPRAFRTTELVKRFVKLGHSVTLYIPESDDDISDFLSVYPVRVKRYRRDEDILFKGSSIVARVGNRLMAQFFEYPSVKIIKPLISALKQESQYDLLISIAMPHSIHWAIGKLYASGKRLAKTWVADCGDPYMLCGTNQYKHPAYFAKQEKRWCTYCDYISVPTEAAKDGYYPEFRDKIRVIPQAFDFEEVKRKEYKPNLVPTFAFSGNLIPKVRDPRPLLDYLSSLGKGFKFILYASKHHLVTPYKETLGDKVEVRGYIPRLDLLYELSGMDFLINIENATQVQTPSKLIDYALTHRPILSVNPLNLDKAAIDQFLVGDYSNQYMVKDVEQYNIVNVAQQFLDLAE